MFIETKRKIWKVNGELAGYVQKWESLENIVILGAKHLVPTDQAMNSHAWLKIEFWIKGCLAMP